MESGQDFQNEYDFTPMDDLQQTEKAGKQRLFFHIWVVQTLVCVALVAALGGMKFILPNYYQVGVQIYHDIAKGGDEFQTGALKFISNLSGWLQDWKPIQRNESKNSSQEDTASSQESTAEQASQEISEASLAPEVAGAGGEQRNAEQGAVPAQCTLEAISFPGESVKPLVGSITSRFGARSYPLNGDPDFHEGVDVAAVEGTEIRAMSGGVVERARCSNGYGNYLRINHQNGFVSLYAHCSKLLVQEGDTVVKGQVIAQVGSTGASTGPHLHFGIQKDGVWVNPSNIFPEYQ